MAPLYNAVDAHTHLDFPELDADREAAIARARAAGVTGFVIAGANPEHWDRVQQVAEAIGAACCLGIHPWWVVGRTEVELQALLADLSDRHGLDGIGETGLDWLRARTEEQRGLQRACFAAHVELAHTDELPLVIHVVRAHAEALGMLAQLDLPAAGGMIHAWSAGPRWVEPAIELGLHLSFGTDLARSEAVRAALREVPDERLLLETDCPDRPIGALRGEPAHLMQIAEIAARIRDTTPEALLTLTGANARALFRGSL